MVAALRGHGLLTVPAGDNVVSILPLLIVKEDHLEEALGALRGCLQSACRERLAGVRVSAAASRVPS